MDRYATYQDNVIQRNQAEEIGLAKKMDGELDSIMIAARNLQAETLQKEVIEATLTDLLLRFLESAERIYPRAGRGEIRIQSDPEVPKLKQLRA